MEEERGNFVALGGGVRNQPYLLFPDTEHPTFISMYTFIAHQAPSGPTGTKVNPLFFENIMNIHWTCSLPHQSALCVLRYEDRRPQAGEGHPKGVGEGPQGHKEEEGVQ